MHTTQNNAGIGFVGGLQLLFIALKLCKVIDWSWWWVLSPIWISTILCVVLIITILILKKFGKL